MMNTNWLSSIFGPGASFVGPSQFNPLAAPDGRTNYTGGLMTDDAYSEAGSRNNAGPNQGPQLGPTPGISSGNVYGVPYGGMSQLGNRPNNAYSGYYTPDPTAPQPGTQLPGEGRVPNYYGGNPAPHATEPSAVTPHAAEPPSWMQPMMGQWGGGAWNVGSGAPASMQQMWLGSMNGGKTWAQAPSYNTSAPQPGQASRGPWSMAPNQDPDSPTWVQGGR